MNRALVFGGLQSGAFRSFGTCPVSQRWHMDKVENRHWYRYAYGLFGLIPLCKQKPFFSRYGYKDKVKQTGALPRLDEDAERIEKPIFRPESPFDQSKALFGQNDYIDILGNHLMKRDKILNFHFLFN